MESQGSLVLGHESKNLGLALSHIFRVIRTFIVPHAEGSLGHHDIGIVKYLLEYLLFLIRQLVVQWLELVKLILDEVLEPVLRVGDFAAWFVRTTTLLVLNLHVSHFLLDFSFFFNLNNNSQYLHQPT